MVSEDIKKLIFQCSSNDETANDISQTFMIPRSTICSILKPPYKKKYIKPGPSAIISPKENKCIRQAVSKIRKSGERVTARKVMQKTKIKAGLRTFQNALTKCNLRYLNISQNIYLSDSHKENRLKIIKKWIFEGVKFKEVIFTDEKKFNMDGPDNYCSWIDKNEKNYRNKRQAGGGGIMVHGALSYNGYLRIIRLKGKVNGDAYRNTLEDLFVDLNARFNTFTFAHDNAPSHTCKKVKSFLEVSEINTLDWPPRSPDLNPIENIWHVLSEIVYDRQQFTSLDALWNAIEDATKIINTDRGDLIKSLYEGIPDRIETVFKKNGDLCS
jgi:hypothetical protein